MSQQEFVTEHITREATDYEGKAIPGSMTIIVCLRCNLDLCKNIHDILIQEFGPEEIYENLCLIKIALTIFPNTYFDQNSQTETRISLDCFYNNVTKYGSDIEYLNKKLKGAAHALLCMALNTAYHERLIRANETIVLTASGELGDKSMHRLVDYYKKIGFEEVFPDDRENLIDERDVPMRSTVKKILLGCKSTEFSEELTQVLKTTETVMTRL